MLRGQISQVDFALWKANWIRYWFLLQFPQTEKKKNVYKTKATHNLVQTFFRILFLHSGNQGRCGHGRNGASSVTPKHLSLHSDLSKPAQALPGTARIVWLSGQTSGTKCSEHPTPPQVTVYQGSDCSHKSERKPARPSLLPIQLVLVTAIVSPTISRSTALARPLYHQDIWGKYRHLSFQFSGSQSVEAAKGNIQVSLSVCF